MLGNIILSGKRIYRAIREQVRNVFGILVDAGVLGTKRSQALIKYGLSQRLIRDFSGDSGHNIDPFSGFLGFGLIHYILVKNIRPKHILCIGSRKGFIPALFALACKDNGYGHVDFVDAGYDAASPSKHWSGVGFWKTDDPERHFAGIGVSAFITTHVMTSRNFAKKFPSKRFQYIYIDGDHSYEGVLSDYTLFWPRLVQNGFMAFHDVIVRGYLDKGKFGVWKFWEDVQKKGHTIVFPFPKESGLGIIQKNNSL